LFWLRNHRPAVIILDLGLPDLSGQEVLHRLREWSNAPVVILSVQDDEAGKVAALDAGADDYGDQTIQTRANCWRAFASRCVMPRRPEEARVFQAGKLLVDLPISSRHRERTRGKTQRH
jgi:two-component system KDP operon response regulator KdpE